MMRFINNISPYTNTYKMYTYEFITSFDNKITTFDINENHMLKHMLHASMEKMEKLVINYVKFENLLYVYSFDMLKSKLEFTVHKTCVMYEKFISRSTHFHL